MDKEILEVTQEDIDNGGESSTNCPLSIAGGRHFKRTTVVNYHSIVIRRRNEDESSKYYKVGDNLLDWIETYDKSKEDANVHAEPIKVIFDPEDMTVDLALEEFAHAQN